MWCVVCAGAGCVKGECQMGRDVGWFLLGSESASYYYLLPVVVVVVAVVLTTTTQ